MLSNALRNWYTFPEEATPQFIGGFIFGITGNAH